MIAPFEIVRPGSVAEASQQLVEGDGDSVLYAGGTELLLVMKKGFLSYSRLVDIKSIPSLSRLEVDDEKGVLRIGATVTHRQLERSPLVEAVLPVLAEMERSVGNVRVRNVGTLVGNLCFAEPRSDPAALLHVLGARVRIESAAGSRELGIDEFIIDAYETALQPGDVVTEVQIPLPRGRWGCAYLKFAYRERPSVGVGARVHLTSASSPKVEAVRVVVGSVGTRPVEVEVAGLFSGLEVRGGDLTDPLWTSAEVLEEALRDRERALGVAFTPALETAIQEAGRLAAEQVDPLDDLYGSASFKRHLTKVFVTRAVRLALLRAYAHAGTR